MSCDEYHGGEKNVQLVEFARQAAYDLKIPFGLINVTQPEKLKNDLVGKLPEGESAVMFRGRAATKLTGNVQKYAWNTFQTCPHEDLEHPERVHIDPLGNLHICQGISLGNIFKEPLHNICRSYYSEANPICGTLLNGGPAELVKRYQLPHKDSYADACHLCYESRQLLRSQFPETLTPDQMYGN